VQFFRPQIFESLSSTVPQQSALKHCISHIGAIVVRQCKKELKSKKTRLGLAGGFSQGINGKLVDIRRCGVNVKTDVHMVLNMQEDKDLVPQCPPGTKKTQHKNKAGSIVAI
jgi:hypothetical protein